MGSKVLFRPVFNHIVTARHFFLRTEVWNYLVDGQSLHFENLIKETVIYYPPGMDLIGGGGGCTQPGPGGVQGVAIFHGKAKKY
jgi:hypothetical protein